MRFQNPKATTQSRLPQVGYVYAPPWASPSFSGCSGSPARLETRLTAVQSSGLGGEMAMGTVVFRAWSDALSMSCGEGGNQTPAGAAERWAGHPGPGA